MRSYSRTRYTLTCLRCGTKFWDYESQIDPQRPHYYCSQRCAGAARRNDEGGFWRRVALMPPVDGWECLEYQGRRIGGYGIFYAGMRRWPAHRYAWTSVFGEVPKGLFVCHECDNRACVHPGHLYVDTQKGNLADMYLRGRGPTGERNGARLAPFLYRGELNGRAKLTESDVRAIRAACAAGEMQRVVATRYGLGQTTVSEIVRRIRWPHVK